MPRGAMTLIRATPPADPVICATTRSESRVRFWTRSSGPRPMWNAPTKLGGDVPFDGANQVGATIRSDNLEIVYASNRSGSILVAAR